MIHGQFVRFRSALFAVWSTIDAAMSIGFLNLCPLGGCEVIDRGLCFLRSASLLIFKFFPRAILMPCCEIIRMRVHPFLVFRSLTRLIRNIPLMVIRLPLRLMPWLRSFGASFRMLLLNIVCIMFAFFRRRTILAPPVIATRYRLIQREVSDRLGGFAFGTPFLCQRNIWGKWPTVVFVTFFAARMDTALAVFTFGKSIKRFGFVTLRAFFHDCLLFRQWAGTGLSVETGHQDLRASVPATQPMSIAYLAYTWR